MKTVLCYLTLSLFAICVSRPYAQDADKTELDSIYALQAERYNAKEFAKVIDLSLYAKSINLNNAQDSITMARITAYIGYANNKLNTFYESISGFEDALKYIPSEKSKAIVYTNYITLYDLLTRYYSLRRYQKALSVAEEAEKLLEHNEYFNLTNYIRLYQRKFKIYSDLGYYDKAAFEVEKIRQKLSATTTTTEEEMRISWIAYFRANLLLNYEEALFIKEQKEDFLEDIIPLKNNIINNLSKLDSIYDSTKTLKNPKSRKDVMSLSQYVGALYYISDFYKVIKDYDKALEYIDKTILYSKKSNEPIRNITEFLRFKANVMHLMGNNEDALKLIAQLQKDFDKTEYNVNEVLTFKGSIYVEQKQLDSVLKYYGQAIQVMHNSDEKLKDDFSNFSSRFRFPDDAKQIQHMSEMLMVHFTDNERALEVSKQYNSLAFNEFLKGHKTLDLSQGNKQLFYKIIQSRIFLNKEDFKDHKAFISDIENINNRLAWKKFSESRNVLQLPIIDSLEHIEYELRQQLLKAKKERSVKQEDSINSRLVNHKKNITQNYPTISDFTQDNFDISSFQKLLNKDDVVLKYLFFYDQFVVFQITKTTITWDLRPWKKVEKQMLEEHLAFIKNPNSTIQLNPELTQLLIPKEATQYASITIIPDTPIYNLPFETLWYNDNYLVKEKAIHYSSHLRFAFLNQNSSNTKSPKATIFAPAYPKGNTSYATRSVPVFLEGAQKEAKTIENLFSSNSFIGTTATKDNFVNSKSEGDILHLAMHATVDNMDPVFSHFSFYNGEKLYLEELYGLKIPSELAVLSACNTGVGKVEDASGVASLQRAFNFAGTKATLASLWEVPDASTSKIMIAFYGYLKDGETKSAALQKAKLDYLQNTEIDKFKHPYYWAGFVLYGTDDPIIEQGISFLWYILGGVLLLYLAYKLFKKRNKSIAN